MTGERLFYLQAAVLCAGLAAWFSWLLTPVVRRIALRAGAVQKPRARDVHTEPVPRLGGLAIYAAFVGALALAAVAMHFFVHKPMAPRAVLAGMGVVTAGTLLTALGALDDLREVSPGRQLLMQ